jgi:hypothetical protein
VVSGQEFLEFFEPIEYLANECSIPFVTNLRMCGVSDNVVSAMSCGCKILIDNGMRYDLICTGLKWKRLTTKLRRLRKAVLADSSWPLSS